MNTQVNYALVGLFVVLLTAVMLVVGIWLSYGLHAKRYNEYLVYINESVSGLTVKAPVKYMGVNIGMVADIRLRHDNPQQVRVLLAIEKGTPVNISTTATLNTQGLTGIAYLELKSAKPDAPPLRPRMGSRFPVIEAAPSLMFRLDTALDDLSSNIKTITNGLSRILNDSNSRALHDTLHNMAEFSTMLADNNKRIAAFINNSSAASERFTPLVEKVERGTDTVTNAARKASAALQSTNDTIVTLRDRTLPDMMNLLDNLHPLVNYLTQYVEQLNANPGIVVRGAKPLPTGPGEQP